MLDLDDLKRLERAVHGGHDWNRGVHDEESCDKCKRKRASVVAASVSAGCGVAVVSIAVFLVGWTTVCQWIGLPWKWALPVLVAAGAAIVFLIAYALAYVADSAAVAAWPGCVVVLVSIAVYLVGLPAASQGVELIWKWAVPISMVVGGAIVFLAAYALASVADSADSFLALVGAIFLSVLAVVLVLRACE